MARFSFKTSSGNLMHLLVQGDLMIDNLLHLCFVLFLGKEDGSAFSPASCSFKARKKGKIPKFTESKFVRLLFIASDREAFQLSPSGYESTRTRPFCGLKRC